MRRNGRIITDADLRRVALALARTEGYETQEVPEGERRAVVREGCILVSGSGLPGRCLLRVRERASPDLAARRSTRSEHVLALVRELRSPRVRGREVEAVVLGYGGVTLEAVLRRGRGLGGGEAATILLGVAAGMEALHGAGWARPTLDTVGVVFHAEGCPALDALDGMIAYSGEAAIADAEAFAALARAVCLRVADGRGMRLLGAVERGLRDGSWAAVEAAVLAVVSPEPVEVDDAEALVGRGHAVALRRSQGVRGRPNAPRPPSGRAGAVAARVLALLDGDVVGVVRSIAAEWLRRRPALVAAAALPIAAAVALIALVPPSGETASAVAEPGRVPAASYSGPASSATPSPGPRVSSRTGAGPAPTAAAATPRASATGGATPSPAASAASARALQHGGPAASGGAGPGGSGRTDLAGDDPVAAARAVLDARHACFAAAGGSPSCLSGVLEPGSPLLTQEAAAGGTAKAAAARDFTGARLTLGERWGDAALVSVAPDPARTPESEPASLLLVRSEAGWRLRAVFP